jgi:hypothetical protein
MFERRHQPVLPIPAFARRLANVGALSLVLVLGSLAVGMLGYRFFEGQGWVEAFLNASMLLAAMGPVGKPETTGGMIFAGCYALYCGLLFISLTGLLLTPVVHRVLHHFHAEVD